MVAPLLVTMLNLGLKREKELREAIKRQKKTDGEMRHIKEVRRNGCALYSYKNKDGPQRHLGNSRLKCFLPNITSIDFEHVTSKLLVFMNSEIILLTYNCNGCVDNCKPKYKPLKAKFWQTLDAHKMRYVCLISEQ